MEKIQSLAGASVGHVRACFSGRCRGFAAPVDLMRAHLRAVNRCAVRRRVASAFAGYLVTDAGPDVLPMFAKHRAWHEQGPDLYCMTSERMGWGYDSQGVESGPLDAPDMVPAGSMLAGSGFDGMASALRRFAGDSRGPESAPVASAGFWPVWRDRESGRVVVVGDAVNFAGGLRLEFTFEPDGNYARTLDAPVFLPAGAMRASMECGEVCAAVLTVSRAGCWK